MASAIIGGLLAGGTRADELVVVEPLDVAREQLLTQQNHSHIQKTFLSHLPQQQAMIDLQVSRAMEKQ